MPPSVPKTPSSSGTVLPRTGIPLPPSCRQSRWRTVECQQWAGIRGRRHLRPASGLPGPCPAESVTADLRWACRLSTRNPADRHSPVVGCRGRPAGLQGVFDRRDGRPAHRPPIQGRTGAPAADVRNSLFIPKQPLAQHTACGKPSSALRPLPGRWRRFPGHR
jgi:hypothetical protein